MDRNKLTQAQTEASEGLVCAHLAELGLEPSDAGKAAWPPLPCARRGAGWCVSPRRLSTDRPC